jgi:hypothetical protein
MRRSFALLLLLVAAASAAKRAKKVKADRTITNKVC